MAVNLKEKRWKKRLLSEVTQQYLRPNCALQILGRPPLSLFLAKKWHNGALDWLSSCTKRGLGRPEEAWHKSCCLPLLAEEEKDSFGVDWTISQLLVHDQGNIQQLYVQGFVCPGCQANISYDRKPHTLMYCLWSISGMPLPRWIVLLVGGC